MATYSKQILSGSTNGKGISVSASASAGTIIHTAISGTSSFDEVWLYAVNTSTSSVKLTIEYGSTSTSDNIEITIPAEAGLTLVVPGLLLNNGLLIRAFAATQDVISIHGYVNRIS